MVNLSYFFYKVYKFCSKFNLFGTGQKNIKNKQKTQKEQFQRLFQIIVEKKEDTITLYPDINNDLAIEDIIYFVPKEGKYKGKNMNIYESYCINPDCNCRTSHLSLVPESKDDESPGYFTISIDNGSITEINRRYAPNEINELANEFSRNLFPKVKSLLNKHYNQAKEYGIKLQRFTLACSSFIEAALVSYCDVYGDMYIWEFKHNGVFYFVDDQYCSNPNCTCRDVTLVFYENKPNGGIQNPIFTVKYEPENKYEIIEKIPPIEKKEIDSIIKAFYENVINLRKLVEMPLVLVEVVRSIKNVVVVKKCFLDCAFGYVILEYFDLFLIRLYNFMEE